MSEAELTRLLSPDHFVRIRRTLGGPAPDVTGAAIEASRAQLEADTRLTATLQDALSEAGNRRRGAVAAL
jgi:hypothetical protein